MPVGFYKITLSYDGTAYHGWQKQPHHQTLSGTIEAALLRITGETVSLIGAGRTDAGVHARGQVAHFQLTKTIEPLRLLAGLNGVLPNDIAVSTVEAVTPDFHARYGAKRKRYRYTIYNGPTRMPFHRTTAWHLAKPLSLPKMRAAARHLVGSHDFTSFCAAENDAKEYHVDLDKITICKEGHQITLTLEAPRFLRYMVRNIVGLLVEMGYGKRLATEIPSILEARDRRRAGPTAPAHGLCLVQIDYD
jgi:tRNA pseudouridine38-40 synthase